jgi:PAS domain S-box-containing protein
VLLVSADDTWRRVTTYMFEEAGYLVDTAAGHRKAIATSARRLPDVIVVRLDTTAMQALLQGLVAGSRAGDIPVVVLTASLTSPEAQYARDAGAVTFVAAGDAIDTLVGEIDTLVAAAPRAQRALLRRLRDLQAIARGYTPDPEGQAAFRRLIDQLQVAMFAVDEEGHCVAASAGAAALTGYSRGQLLRASVFHARFARGRVSAARWHDFLQRRHFAGTTTITTHEGEDLPVHAAALAVILPGVYVAAVIPA